MCPAVFDRATGLPNIYKTLKRNQCKSLISKGSVGKTLLTTTFFCIWSGFRRANAGGQPVTGRVSWRDLSASLRLNTALGHME